MDYQVANFKQKYEGYEVKTEIADSETDTAFIVHVRHPISQRVKYVAVTVESVANKRGYIPAKTIHTIAKQIIESFKPEEELENILIPQEQ